MMKSFVFAAATTAALASVASAGITFTRSAAAAPTYSTTLTFDEVGGPTGAVSGNEWQSIGLSSLVGGAAQSVDAVNATPGFGWLGTGNVFSGPFGAFATFSNDLTALSAQYWDTSGPASPFGGGAGIIVLNDGVEVGFYGAFTPTFGPGGQTWFNIVATDGSVFDEVRFVGFGFPADAFIDNLSWESIPSPGALALFGFGALASSRRRRS
jgi:hypothetical protein